MFGHYPGFKVLGTGNLPPEEYTKKMAEAVYCLSPAGWGWGSRFKTSVTRGCIPIVVQVKQLAAVLCCLWQCVARQCALIGGLPKLSLMWGFGGLCFI